MPSKLDEMLSIPKGQEWKLLTLEIGMGQRWSPQGFLTLFKKPSFSSGVTGNVSINDNGDRDADYALLDMNPETGRFDVRPKSLRPWRSLKLFNFRLCFSTAVSPILWIRWPTQPFIGQAVQVILRTPLPVGLTDRFAKRRTIWSSTSFFQLSWASLSLAWWSCHSSSTGIWIRIMLHLAHFSATLSKMALFLEIIGGKRNWRGCHGKSSQKICCTLTWVPGTTWDHATVWANLVFR